MPARTHGMSDTRIYSSWEAMKRRCGAKYQAKKPSYAGVKFDPRWATFAGFIAHPPAAIIPGESIARAHFNGAVLGRVGDLGDYSPENCYWQTKTESTREMYSRSGHGVSGLRLADGRLVADVCREMGIDKNVVTTRLWNGWDEEAALSTPIKKLGKRPAPGTPCVGCDRPLADRNSEHGPVCGACRRCVKANGSFTRPHPEKARAR